MNPKDDPPPIDRRIAAVSAPQFGLISRDQLLALGLGLTGIRERLRTGRLHRKRRNVFAVGQPVLRPEAEWLAAVLTCGPGAALSHTSAAALWGIRPSASPTIHVAVPGHNGRQRRRRLRIHRSRRLAADDVTVREGIPVTTVARTLLDLADLLPDQPLKRAIDEAEYRSVFDLRAVLATIERNPGRRGSRVLALAVEPLQRTRSGYEDRFLALCRTHGIPLPRVNAWLDGHEVDFHWPESRLIVEVDVHPSHRTRAGRGRDRQRDRRMRRAGLETIRVTADDLDDGSALAARLLGWIAAS